MTNRKANGSEKGSTNIVTLSPRASDSPDVPPPATPSRVRFIPRECRENWFMAWRSRRVSTMALVRRNPGFRQLDIESAILDELDERERRRERLDRVTEFVSRRQAA